MRERQALGISKNLFSICGKPVASFDELLEWKEGELDPQAKKMLDRWPELVGQYGGDEHVVKIRDKEIRTQLTRTSLSGSTIRKVYAAALSRMKARFCVF